MHGIESKSQETAGRVRELSEGVRTGLIAQMRDGAGDLKVLERSVGTVVETMQANVDRLEKELKREGLDKETAGLLEDILFDAQDNLDKSKKGCLPVIRSVVKKLGATMNEADGTAASVAGIEDTMTLFATTAQVAAATADGAVRVSDKSRADAAAARSRILGALGIGMVVAIVVPIVITRRITRPIAQLVGAMKVVADGDMTKSVQIDRKDEIGDLAHWFNTCAGQLGALIMGVKQATFQVASTTSEIATASQSLAEGAGRQAASLQQISASIEQMSAMTQQSAENVERANVMAATSRVSADRGQVEMKQMTLAMNQIKESATEIAKIIRVIDEIAFQTNLLALNAAVEAARAGEAGKGFAVVADEVRRLAHRSAEAAKTTSSMIEQSTQRAESGVQIADRVGKALDEIATATTKVNTILSEIASASSEQAKGIGQVNTGITELDKVTQQTAGNSEELASGAKETAAQVTSLQELVRQFKTKEAETSNN